MRLRIPWSRPIWRIGTPPHGWRGFFWEIGIVVLGVLLALAATEAVRWRDDSNRSHEAHQNVRTEIAEALGKMAGRMQVQPCIDRRMREIAASLAAVDRGEAAQPFSWIGRPPFWPLSVARWETATRSGGTSLFTADEQAGYAFIYTGTGDFEGYEREEQAAWAQLRSLTEMRNIEAPQRAFLTQSLQVARLASFRLALIAQQRIEAGRRLGIAPARPELAPLRAICFDRGTPRAAANRAIGRGLDEPD